MDQVNDGHRVSASVGTYRASAWGLHEMLGNPAEWTASDCAPQSAGEGMIRAKSVRGGSWYDAPHLARSASRRQNPGYRRVFDVGIRVAAR